MQEIIKNVKPEQWMIALKTSSEAVNELVFKNMSERAATMLKEDMEAMAAVKLSDVEAMQYEIVQVARKLEEEIRCVLKVETLPSYKVKNIKKARTFFVRAFYLSQSPW